MQRRLGATPLLLNGEASKVSIALSFDRFILRIYTTFGHARAARALVHVCSPCLINATLDAEFSSGLPAGQTLESTVNRTLQALLTVIRRTFTTSHVANMPRRM